MPKKMINCRICQDEFSTKQTLKVHFRRRHKKSIFICKICHVTCYSIDEKILHRINHHKFIFKCDNCERTFKEKKGLNRHVRRNHKDLQLNYVISSKNIRPSKCFSTSNSLTTSSKNKKQMTSSALVKKSNKRTIILRLKGIYVIGKNSLKCENADKKPTLVKCKIARVQSHDTRPQRGAKLEKLAFYVIFIHTI